MMNSLNSLKLIANEFDRLGLSLQADRIDAILVRLAQAPAPAVDPAGVPPPAPMTPPVDMGPPPAIKDPAKSKENNKWRMVRSTYLMFRKLRDLYAVYLPKLDYFGEDNIKAVFSAFDQLLALFQAVLRDKPLDINNNDIQDYNGRLKRIENELKRSTQMRLTPIKAKVDKFLIYEELEGLVDKLERHYDTGLSDLNPVVRKARALRNTFANVIQSVSEQIAHADLIELS